MTDTQFYILVTVLGTGLGVIGAAIRFSVGRIISALDKNSDAMIENTASNAVLSTKIDSISTYLKEVRERDKTPIEGVPTSRGRYGHVRRKSEPGDE